MTTARERHLKARYGITEAIYNKMLKQQGSKCGVCRRPAETFRTRLCVDHNHKTLEIRGLLCHHCNHRIIGRHTDPELFRAAYEYLSNGTGLFAPPKKKKRRRSKSRRT
jgi:DNA-directed RNA polymerase subunit RPC12/RpoP